MRLQTNALKGKKLLLMGSKAFRKKELPPSVTNILDNAIARNMRIVVGEAPGANRLFQDYLADQKYKRVTVGHARSIRYNAGNWRTKQYGEKVSEREKNMIAECDSAIIIWTDHSGVIAEDLEILKWTGKPTYVFEYSNKTGKGKADWIDPKRVYDPYFQWKERMRELKRKRPSRL
jgi:hypothetical protein